MTEKTTNNASTSVADLRKLALAATQGQWETDCKEHDAPYQNIRIKAGGRDICEIWIDDAPVHDYNAEQTANAAYIAAASPAVVIGLLDENMQLRSDAADVGRIVETYIQHGLSLQTEAETLKLVIDQKNERIASCESALEKAFLENTKLHAEVETLETKVLGLEVGTEGYAECRKDRERLSAEVVRLKTFLKQFSAKCPEGLGLQLLIATALDGTATGIAHTEGE